jgi:hypothetical protein
VSRPAGWLALVLAISLLLLSAPPALAAEDPGGTGDKATDMVVDILVARPLGLAATVAGTALTVIALPFTLPSGSVQKSYESLVAEPAAYTFKRPLGEFESRD